MNASSSNSPSGGGYERPNCKFRCGRGAAWGQPCASGPTPHGQCGGTHECEPALQNGKAVCRRPKEAGGPCDTGPKPDGTCSQVHPPCVPRPTLRTRRGKLAVQLTTLTALLLAAGFHFGGWMKSNPLSADPGPLSAKHASFTAALGCVACHPLHDQEISGLARAVVTGHGMNQPCSACHKFGGPANQPHNETFAAHGGPRETDCRMCHTEHRGAHANLTALTDTQCHICHKEKFGKFGLDHPAFPRDFPRLARGGIQFNHATHLQEHFAKPEFQSRAAANCTDCHAVTAADRHVRTAGFEAACARCHAEQIPQNDLTLLRLPEPVPAADVAALDPADATAFMSWILSRGIVANSYGERLHLLVRFLAKDGTPALTRTLEATNSGQTLLAGLNPELLIQPASLWLKPQAYKAPATQPGSGWYWFDDLYPEFRYKPVGHADPVARAWLEYVLTKARPTNDAEAKAAATFRAELTHARTGVGRCFKCHDPEAVTANSVAGWDYRKPASSPHTTFSHGAHLGLQFCADCHILNPKADFASQFTDLNRTKVVGNFHGITQAGCIQCHDAGKVRSDCRLCHKYHRDAATVPAP